MNWQTLFSQLPLPALIGWMLAVGIPYLTALAVRGPSHLAGVLTAALSLLDGFLVELSQQGQHYNFGTAAGQAFLVWLTATKWHSKVLMATHTEAKLYAWPRPKPAPAAPPAQAAA